MTGPHEHGAEIVRVLHAFAGSLQRDALVFAELRVLLSELFEEWGILRIDDARLADVDAESAGTGGDVRRIAEQDEFADVHLQDFVRGAKNPVVGTFGKHDAPFTGTCALHEHRLEHERCDGGCARDPNAIEQDGLVHLGREFTECSRNLATAIRVDVAVELVKEMQRVVCIRLHRDCRDARGLE